MLLSYTLWHVPVLPMSVLASRYTCILLHDGELVYDVVLRSRDRRGSRITGSTKISAGSGRVSGQSCEFLLICTVVN